MFTTPNFALGYKTALCPKMYNGRWQTYVFLNEITCLENKPKKLKYNIWLGKWEVIYDYSSSIDLRGIEI